MIQIKLLAAGNAWQFLTVRFTMKLLLCFLLCLSLNAYPQHKNLSIKFSPFCLVDEPGLPTIQPGIEFSLSERFTWYNEFGIKYRKGWYEKGGTDTNFIPSKGLKLKTEFRYYTLRNEEKFTGEYAAVNAFYIMDHHNTEIGYYYQRDSSVTKADAFGVRKKVLGVNLLYGFQKMISKTIMADYYFGLGLRFRHITGVNKEYDRNRDTYVGVVDVNVHDTKQRAEAMGGFSRVPNFTLGVRLCFSL